MNRYQAIALVIAGLLAGISILGLSMFGIAASSAWVMIVVIATIAGFGAGMIDAGLKANYNALLAEFSSYYWSHGIEDQKIFQKFLTQKYGKVDYRVLAHAILAYRRAKNGLLRPYPGARNVLKELL